MNVLDERFRSISDEILGKSDPFVCDDDLALSKMFAVLPYKIGVLVACLDCLLPSVLPKRAILAGNGADFSVEFRSAHDSVGKAAEVFEPFFFPARSQSVGLPGCRGTLCPRGDELRSFG